MDACSSNVNLAAVLSTEVARLQEANAVLMPQSIGTLCDVERAEQILYRQAELASRERDRDLRKRCWNFDALIRQRGERYAGCRIKNYEVTTPQQREAIAKLKSYLDGIQDNLENGRGLLLFGPKGCGKDHLAMACAHHAIAKMDPHTFTVQWANGMDIFARVRDSMNPDGGETEEQVFGDLAHKGLLWISDPVPPTGTLTEFQQTFLFRVLDHRYNHLLPTWVTCNVTSGGELDTRIGAQNGDRLRHGAHAIFTNWDSYRKVAQ